MTKLINDHLFKIIGALCVAIASIMAYGFIAGRVMSEPKQIVGELLYMAMQDYRYQVRHGKVDLSKKRQLTPMIVCKKINAEIQEELEQRFLTEGDKGELVNEEFLSLKEINENYTWREYRELIEDNHLESARRKAVKSIEDTHRNINIKSWSQQWKPYWDDIQRCLGSLDRKGLRPITDAVHAHNDKQGRPTST